MGFVNAFYYWKAIFERKLRPLCVHTEAVMVDEVWEIIRRKTRQKKIHTWYVMTPENYSYFKSSFNVKLSKSEVSRIMKERYIWMKENGQKLELHIHFSIIMNMSYAEQENLIRDSINWMETELGITPREIVCGWWCFNEDTLKILKKYNLKLIRFKDYDSEHDYEWVFNPKL